MFDWIRHSLAPFKGAEYQERLGQLIRNAPVPVFWLFGKTQTGKTSIIKYLTGAEDAEIGEGFRPRTRFSREYRFPTPETPLMVFLDTRGLEEADYDPDEDIKRFHAQAHVMVVTARLLDFATETLIDHLRRIRADEPGRPIVLALTCLHEAYPQSQHVDPYPFGGPIASPSAAPENLRRAVAAQEEHFRGLYDFVVPLDLTPASEGFHDPEYGGPRLKQVLIDALPSTYRQTLLNLEAATHALRDYFERRALPHILGFSTLAASAGAIPIPWIDMLILPGIQTNMIFHLARLYGQPLSAQRFLELASALGLGMLMRQGIRELMKFIPIIGSIAGATLAGSATFALGKAFCHYYGVVQQGHVPRPDELKKYYHEQLAQAEKLWIR